MDQIVELVPVITLDHDESPRWIFLVFQTVSWCQEAAEVNQCAGSFRDIAICLAQSNTELEPACQQELMQAAMEHSDIEVLNLLVTRELVGLQAPKQDPQEAPAMNEHTDEHHGHDQCHELVQWCQQCLDAVDTASSCAALGQDAVTLRQRVVTAAKADLETQDRCRHQAGCQACCMHG